MKAAAFDYIRADSLAQICDLLAEPGREARILAGGQSLVPMMAIRLARPDLLVDVNRAGALQGIALGDGGLVIGAGVRQAEAEGSALVHRHAPLLAAALPHIGHGQTRNRGTIGGSMAHGDPSAEIPLVAVALDAAIRLRSVRGERTVSAAAFLQGPMTTAMETDECLVAMRIPAAAAAGRIGVAVEEVAMRRGDFAMLAAAAEIALDETGRCCRARLALGGAGPVPIRAAPSEAALTGREVTEEAAFGAARLTAPLLDPDSDPFASAAWRRRVAPGLLARAILNAARRAGAPETLSRPARP